jgi:hypothetical protein
MSTAVGRGARPGAVLAFAVVALWHLPRFVGRKSSGGERIAMMMSGAGRVGRGIVVWVMAVIAALALSALAASPAIADSASAVSASLSGVGCASDGTCWGAGTNAGRYPTAGVLVPISFGKPGSPKQISGASELSGVACETPTSCVAVGQQGGNPSSGVVVPITNGVPGSAEPWPARTVAPVWPVPPAPGAWPWAGAARKPEATRRGSWCRSPA